ncbi:hypothetical protein SARC_13501 [Sphaeroforma arctica JP610]|uniref:Uncharacterized protein n=1 Tax=Sphaeroforma arctica JP610 TaxID=667725 RepID=A0A0L0FAZ9_9EUKA|nr:hypothetical protein SARC_13501 [Sphaeroforma arctica JP610]KNC73940.1 hypothetical protein SARC_13501 [Sphaeroforma arctica JP610]|eukprot:XP_014147842.1 hypothetical protein SARC_13501 [Sphaeroforma arctica JP610]
MEHLVNDEQTLVRWIVTAVAGTVKCFVMNVLDSLAKIEKDDAYASLITAPIGAAAGNVGGSTLDRLLSFKRNGNEYIPIAQGGNMMAFARAQRLYCDSISTMVDESYMFGERIMGHTCQRGGEHFNNGAYATDLVAAG